MENFEESYYRGLAVIDRISEIAISKYKTYSNFSRNMGWKRTYWQTCVDCGRTIKTKTLIKIAKVLNISVEYLLTGKNQCQYTAENLSYENLGKIKISHAPASIYTIQNRIRNKVNQDISIQTLFNFEKASKVDVMKLLRGLVQ